MAATAQEAHEIIKQYAEETMTTFVSMRKMKQFGITGIINFHVYSTEVEYNS